MGKPPRLFVATARGRPGRAALFRQSPIVLVGLGTIPLLVLLGLPIVGVIVESFRPFESGRVGGQISAGFTLENYAAFAHPVYLAVFRDTLMLSTIAAFLSVVFGFPIAALVVLSENPLLRRAIIAVLIAALFLNTITRVYSIAISFSPAGFGVGLAGILGLSISSPLFLDITLIAGLLHFMLPISTLTIIGVVQSINRRFIEVAQSLGASATSAHLTVTLPLCAPGLVSAFVLALTIGISSFVVPMILGKGRVDFVANFIYRRFSEMANYPSGAALAVLLLFASIAIFWGMSAITRRRTQS